MEEGKRQQKGLLRAKGRQQQRGQEAGHRRAATVETFFIWLPFFLALLPPAKECKGGRREGEESEAESR